MPQRSAQEGDTARKRCVKIGCISPARATRPLTDRALSSRVDESFDRDAVHLDVDVKHVDLAEPGGLASVPKARDKNDGRREAHDSGIDSIACSMFSNTRSCLMASSIFC